MRKGQRRDNHRKGGANANAFPGVVFIPRDSKAAAQREKEKRNENVYPRKRWSAGRSVRDLLVEANNFGRCCAYCAPSEAIPGPVDVYLYNTFKYSMTCSIFESSATT
jgi:hypothetical protein